MIAHHAQETQTEVELDQAAQPTICRDRGHRDGAANPSPSPGNRHLSNRAGRSPRAQLSADAKIRKGISRVGAAQLQQIAKMLGVDIPFFYDGGGKEPDGDSLLLVNSVFSLRLLRAYTAIKDKAVRRKLVILVEMIAASQRYSSSQDHQRS